MLSPHLPDPQAAYRRDRLRHLDTLLAQLESMNVREVGQLTRSLREQLSHAGVVFREGAAASEIIDLVFRAQEAYLCPMPAVVTPRRSAA